MPTQQDSERRDVIAATAIRVLITAYLGALIIGGVWLINLYLDMVGHL